MKIIVCSKKDMRTQWYTNKNWFFDVKKYFISICGSEDDFAYPYMNSHVLKLRFDDITEKEEYCILFNKEHASKIHEFIKTIPENSWIYINCAAGISRSGAVGYCLNDYFNENNKEDYNWFFENNKQIQPNPIVKKILNNELFGEVDYNEIFKD